jgi:hypothetical protein
METDISPEDRELITRYLIHLIEKGEPLQPVEEIDIAYVLELARLGLLS